MEFRRCETCKIGYEEHPRAGTSDDVEGFIALLHRFLGLIFTVKELRALWRKIVRYGPESVFFYMNKAKIYVVV